MSLELEQIHEDMLNAIHDRYQKTLGFPAYDFTRAFALAVLSLDGDVEVAERRLNVENLTGQELDLFSSSTGGCPGGMPPMPPPPCGW